MRGAWTVGVAVAVVAGCSFDGRGASSDAPPGVADAAVDADPLAPDAPDAPPGTPDARIDAAIIDAAVPDAAPCPGSYAPIANGTTLYRFVGTGDDWVAAEQDCEDDGGGTHLVVFDDAGERNAVQAAVADDVWIGFSDRNTEGSWIAVNGQTAIFTGGLPGGDTNNNCARLKNSNGNLEDRVCAGSEAYVCECDGIPGDPANY